MRLGSDFETLLHFPRAENVAATLKTRSGTNGIILKFSQARTAEIEVSKEVTQRATLRLRRLTAEYPRRFLDAQLSSHGTYMVSRLRVSYVCVGWTHLRLVHRSASQLSIFFLSSKTQNSKSSKIVGHASEMYMTSALFSHRGGSKEFGDIR